MAYRIQATTPTDVDLLQALRHRAWTRHITVSEVMREAFNLVLDSPGPVVPSLSGNDGD